MRRLILLFLTIAAFSAGLSAGSLEISLSPSVSAAAFVRGSDGVENVDLSRYVSGSFIASAGLFWDIKPWISAGVVSYVDSKSIYEQAGTFMTIPLMAAMRLSYSGDGFMLPLTLMAGGHVQTVGESMKAGTAFAASLGAAVRLAGNLFLDMSTWVTLLLQHGSGGVSSYQVVVRPVAVGLRASF